MAAACSAALHVVGQKCCDDGTARLATFRAKRGLSALSVIHEIHGFLKICVPG